MNKQFQSEILKDGYLRVDETIILKWKKILYKGLQSILLAIQQGFVYSSLNLYVPKEGVYFFLFVYSSLNLYVPKEGVYFFPK
jgi:hypothetical protein